MIWLNIGLPWKKKQNTYYLRFVFTPKTTAFLKTGFVFTVKSTEGDWRALESMGDPDGVWTDSLPRRRRSCSVTAIGRRDRHWYFLILRQRGHAVTTSTVLSNKNTSCNPSNLMDTNCSVQECMPCYCNAKRCCYMWGVFAWENQCQRKNDSTYIKYAFFYGFDKSVGMPLF